MMIRRKIFTRTQSWTEEGIPINLKKFLFLFSSPKSVLADYSLRRRKWRDDYVGDTNFNDKCMKETVQF
jgi:hypothetical protein